MSDAFRPALASAYTEDLSGLVVVLADGMPVMRLRPNQALRLIGRIAEALASSHSLSTAAVRSGCAGEGEGAAVSSPDPT